MDIARAKGVDLGLIHATCRKTYDDIPPDTIPSAVGLIGRFMLFATGIGVGTILLILVVACVLEAIH